MAEDQTNAVAVREWDDPLPELASQKALRRYKAVRDFAAQNMKMGEHFDVLPDEQWKADGKSADLVLADPKIKKFFTQAGADMLNMAWGIHSNCEVISSKEDAEEPHYAYTVRVTLLTASDIPLGNAIASCSSKEAKYAFRWMTKADIETTPRLKGLDLAECKSKQFGRNVKYRVPNLDAADLANTILQMAEKRAYVKITRRTHGITEMFNQPLDEFTSDGKKSGEDLHQDREAVVSELISLGATEGQIEALLGYAISRLSKNGVCYLEGLVAEINSGDSNWSDIIRNVHRPEEKEQSPKPTPEKGKLSMDNVKAGDPATHTNVKDPMRPAEEAQTGLGLQHQMEPWEQLEEDFKAGALATGLKPKSKQWDVAVKACLEAGEAGQWVDVQTPKQVEKCRTWMSEFFSK